MKWDKKIPESGLMSSFTFYYFAELWKDNIEAELQRGTIYVFFLF